VRQQTKINVLRFFVALITGSLLAVGFVHLFCSISVHNCESMFEFVARVLGLGFETAWFTVLITVTAIAGVFSTLSWIVFRRWGPLRNQTDSSATIKDVP